jgi:hypothetical protein
LTPEQKANNLDAAHKQAWYQAWTTTALEQTKSIFTLASAGVGLSLTLLFQLPTKPTDGAWAPVWMLFAAIAFGAAAIASALVFGVNKTMAEYQLSNSDSQYVDARIQFRDGVARLAFYLAMLFMVCAAVAHMWLDPDTPKEVKIITLEQRGQHGKP